MPLKPNSTIVFLTLFLSLSCLRNIYGQTYTIKDFYHYDSELEYLTDSIFNTLSTKEKIAQTIFSSAGELGKPMDVAMDLAAKGTVGGFVFLKGSKAEHSRAISKLNEMVSKNKLTPLLFGIDAEPTLFNGRVQGSYNIIKTNKIKTTSQSDSIAMRISGELKNMGIHINFAPVLDVSQRNEAIGSRSFGSDPKKVVALADAFVQGTQDCNIAATLKHFPGHGLVSGDTHWALVHIDGNLQEIQNYRPLIQNGTAAIMVGHLAVKNNREYDTGGLPSTISPKIVTGLLKNEMGFKGIIFTDAMNMSAITNIEDAPLKASMAGVDIILMPPNEQETMERMERELHLNASYRKRLYQSVKKIIRLKICLGVFNDL